MAESFRKKFFILLGVLNLLPAFTQIKPLLLTETDFKVKNRSTERFYFGFAQGDKVTFSTFIEGGIKDFSFQEYGGTSIFKLSYPDSVMEHTIEIDHDGIYFFDFHQAGFLAGSRYCSLKVMRNPASKETENFNSTVYWDSKTDTIKFKETEKYVLKVDTIVTPVADQQIKLKKKGSTDQTHLMFQLPDSCDAWAYYIASGKEAGKIYYQAEEQFREKMPHLKKYDLLTNIAMNGSASFPSKPGCTEVKYAFVIKGPDYVQNVIDTANRILGPKSTCLDFGKAKKSKQQPTHIFLQNESNKSLNVVVKIVAVQYLIHWGYREIEKFRTETHSFPYLKN